MITKNIKLTIKNCEQLQWKEFTQTLRDIQYLTYKACNRAMTYFYTFEQGNMELQEKFEEKIKDKDIFNKSLGAWIENRMNEIMNICLSNNVAQTRQFVEKRYKDDKKKGLLKGEVGISNFKRDMPIFIHNNAFKISQGNSGYEFDMGFFNLPYQKEHNIKRLTLHIDKLDANKKATLNKLIAGSYKQGGATITRDSKNKWYINLSFSFEPEKEVNLDLNKILGVDLGIVNVATMQIYNANEENYEKLSWKECVISGQELITFRQKTEARRKELSIASKCVGEGRVGHGYNTRMKPVLQIGDKIARFRDTYNHKVSRYIVDLALKHNCGIIQMENLSGFSEHQSESLLKNWSYFDLQNKVKYKAEEKGIQVIFINPQYTSKRCSKCGCIHEDNRDCKNNQAKFKCMNCPHEENADINAAKNIAIPNIEEIIKDCIDNNKISKKVS